MELHPLDQPEWHWEHQLRTRFPLVELRARAVATRCAHLPRAACQVTRSLKQASYDQGLQERFNRLFLSIVIVLTCLVIDVVRRKLR